MARELNQTQKKKQQQQKVNLSPVASRIFVNEHHPQAKSRKISLFSIYGQSN
jgi:hypothetical protein